MERVYWRSYLDAVPSKLPLTCPTCLDAAFGARPPLDLDSNEAGQDWIKGRHRPAS
jgi:hypothetical protein